MDLKFMQRVQAAGWPIRFVTDTHVYAECPQPGCGLAVKFSPGHPVRPACSPTKGQIVESYDSGRMILKGRRLDLGLTIEDVEDIIGCAHTHLAKVERDSWASDAVATNRMPNVQFFVDWANGVGYDVVLVPRPLPAKALRVVSETRFFSRLKALGARMIPSK